VVREFLIEGIAEIPAVREVETRRLDELALGTDAFEKHDQLQLEKDHRVDARSTSRGLQH
jgi:hypothetical protein